MPSFVCVVSYPTRRMQEAHNNESSLPVMFDESATYLRGCLEGNCPVRAFQPIPCLLIIQVEAGAMGHRAYR